MAAISQPSETNQPEQVLLGYQEPKVDIKSIAENDLLSEVGVKSFNIEVADRYVEADPENYRQVTQIVEAMISVAEEHSIEYDPIDPFNNPLTKMFFGDYEQRQGLAGDPVIEDFFERLAEQDNLDHPISVAFSDFANPSANLTGQQWRHTVPRAMALLPLQNPDLKEIPGNQEPLQEWARLFFTHCGDGLGLRSRAAVMSGLIAEHFHEQGQDRKFKWASLAAGAADPVLKAMGMLNGRGQNVHLSVVDYDEEALNMADKLAQQHEIRPDQLTKYNRNLRRQKEIIEEFGKESFDVIDILGFFEYLPDNPNWRFSAQSFLKTAYEMVHPGGMVIFGNMLDSHPQLDFTLKVVQWPHIRPRSPKEIATIIEQAGIDLGKAEMYFPTDGVYTVVTIKK